MGWSGASSGTCWKMGHGVRGSGEPSGADLSLMQSPTKIWHPYGAHFS